MAYSHEEQMWLDTCFNQLIEDEDQDMQPTEQNKEDEQEEHLLVAFPFKYVTKKPQAMNKSAVFFIQS